MTAFGAVGVSESFALGVGSGDISDPFPVPAGFTGHVYVHGVGGNHMAVFVVGSDGNAQFSGAGGFLVRINQHDMPNVTIEQTAVKQWRITHVPSFGGAGAKVAVAIVGTRLAQG